MPIIVTYPWFRSYFVIYEISFWPAQLMKYATAWLSDTENRFFLDFRTWNEYRSKSWNFVFIELFMLPDMLCLLQPGSDHKTDNLFRFWSYVDTKVSSYRMNKYFLQPSATTCRKSCLGQIPNIEIQSHFYFPHRQTLIGWAITVFLTSRLKKFILPPTRFILPPAPKKHHLHRQYDRNG